MMKDVNIVASTALQAIDDMGRSEGHHGRCQCGDA